MSRTKFILKSPPGVRDQECVIGGTYYFPDGDGVVETTNTEHADTMKQHGFTLLEEVGIAKPTAQLGLIQAPDDLGKAELLNALAIRGLTFEADSTRAFLAEQAESWNNARRGKQRFDNAAEGERARRPAPAAQPPQDATPAALAPVATEAPAVPPTPAAAPSTGPTMPDFENFSREDLKEFLITRAAEGYKPNLSGPVMIEMAKTAWAKTVAEKAKAAA